MFAIVSQPIKFDNSRYTGKHNTFIYFCEYIFNVTNIFTMCTLLFLASEFCFSCISSLRRQSFTVDL